VFLLHILAGGVRIQFFAPTFPMGFWCEDTIRRSAKQAIDIALIIFVECYPRKPSMAITNLTLSPEALCARQLVGDTEIKILFVSSYRSLLFFLDSISRKMLRMLLQRVVVVLLFITSSTAQFPPTPEGVTVLQSKFGDGVTISYKEVGLISYSSRE
jgi:hypothetical protein